MAEEEDIVKNDMAALYGGDFEDDDDDDDADFDNEAAEAEAAAEDALLDAEMESEAVVGSSAGGGEPTSADATAALTESKAALAGSGIENAPTVTPVVSVSGSGPLGPRVRLPGFHNMLEPRAPVQAFEYAADGALSIVKGAAENRARSDAYGAELSQALDLQREIDSLTEFVSLFLALPRCSCSSRVLVLLLNPHHASKHVLLRANAPNNTSPRSRNATRDTRHGSALAQHGRAR